MSEAISAEEKAYFQVLDNLNETIYMRVVGSMSIDQNETYPALLASMRPPIETVARELHSVYTNAPVHFSPKPDGTLRVKPLPNHFIEWTLTDLATSLRDSIALRHFLARTPDFGDIISTGPGIMLMLAFDRLRTAQKEGDWRYNLNTWTQIMNTYTA